MRVVLLHVHVTYSTCLARSNDAALAADVRAGWLTPLLHEMSDKRRLVLTPVIDRLNKTDVSFGTGSAHTIGGFGFDLIFRWFSMSQEEIGQRKIVPAHRADPFRYCDVTATVRSSVIKLRRFWTGTNFSC